MRTIATLLALAVAVSAGEISIAKKNVAEECPPDPRLIVGFNSSYVFASDFERGDDASGDAASQNFRASYRFPIDGPALGGWDCAQWYFRAGVSYERFDFNHAGGLPLPNTLQSVSAVLALEYIVRGRPAVLLEVFPGAYFEHDIDPDTFAVPARVAGVIRLSDSVFGIVVASYRGFGDTPVLPVLGVQWNINDAWTLSLVPPDPKLIYAPNDTWAFWVGGEIAGGGFRTDARHVERKPSLNGAVVTYSEYRAGAGFTFSGDRWSAEVGAGYAFQRKFDYYRAEEGYETGEGAPYVKVELRAKF